MGVRIILTQRTDDFIVDDADADADDMPAARMADIMRHREVRQPDPVLQQESLDFVAQALQYKSRRRREEMLERGTTDPVGNNKMWVLHQWSA